MVSRTLSVALVVAVAVFLEPYPVGAQGSDRDRVEGTVEAVKGPTRVAVRTPDGLVTVDLGELGGVTVSVTPGQKIVAVGTMESGGEILHAVHIESPASP